jgi:hypothetical protein
LVTTPVSIVLNGRPLSTLCTRSCRSFQGNVSLMMGGLISE